MGSLLGSRAASSRSLVKKKKRLYRRWLLVKVSMSTLMCQHPCKFTYWELRPGKILTQALNRTELNLGLGDITRSTFYLPTLRTKLEAISTAVHDGQGFFVLRGWQPDKFSQFENALVFVGISSYIAEKRGRQNQRGMILSELSIIMPYNSTKWKTNG